MGKTTRIAWTDATWNPWYGCTEVSPGCDHCYAKRVLARMGKLWRVQRASKATYRAPLSWLEPRRVFTCSLSDFFHPAVPEEWRTDAWQVILATPEHTYQILTKRPGLMVAWAKRWGWPNNAWAGVSVESQKYAPRITVLARVPARVQFISCEPLLGPLDLRRWLGQGAVHQVIVGGESGLGHRPMDLDWARALRDQCQAAGVDFFFKQGSGPRPGMNPVLDGREWKEIPF